jgi:membrane-associated phospholipid phosphatase
MQDAWMAGAFAAATVAAMPFDERMAEWMQRPGLQNSQALQSTANVFRPLADPGAVIIAGGLYVAGRLSHHATAAAIGLHSGEAIVAAGAAEWLISAVSGRARPRVDIHRPQDYKLGRGFGAAGNYQSFPSGHATAAFALAAAVTAEAGNRWPHEHVLIGVLAYGGATVSALSRMYNNAHWGSDVLLGAGLGTVAGRVVVRWQHGHPNNWIDRTFLHLSVALAPGGGTMVGFSAAW